MLQGSPQNQQTVEKLRQQLAEVIDECVFVESQRSEAERLAEAGRQREQALVTALEEMIGYTLLLEQRVIAPALGSLTVILRDFHEASQRRAAGVSLSTVPSINSENQPRLAKLLASMKTPFPETVREAERTRLQLSSPVSVDNAIVLLQALTEETESLRSLLRSTARPLKASTSSPERRQPTSDSVTSPPLASLRQTIGGAPEKNHAEMIALQNELILVQQRAEAQVLAATSDRDVLQVRLDETTRQLRDAQMEVENAHLKCLSTSNIEQLYQQSVTERRLLQERLQQYEREAQKAAEEKMMVAQKFDVLQRALSQQQRRPGGSSPDRRFGGDVSYSDDSEVSYLRSQLDASRQELRNAEERFEAEINQLKKRLSSGGGAGSVAVVPNQSQLRALELTVQALNTELAGLEHRLLQQESESGSKQRDLEVEINQERQRVAREQQETDAIMAQLSKELEQTMTENAELRLRLREEQEQPSRRRHRS